MCQAQVKLELSIKFKLMYSSLLAWVLGGGWVLDFTRLMLISTQVEVVVEVGVELGNSKMPLKSLCLMVKTFLIANGMFQTFLVCI